MLKRNLPFATAQHSWQRWLLQPWPPAPLLPVLRAGGPPDPLLCPYLVLPLQAHHAALWLAANPPAARTQAYEPVQRYFGHHQHAAMHMSRGRCFDTTTNLFTGLQRALHTTCLEPEAQLYKLHMQDSSVDEHWGFISFQHEPLRTKSVSTSAAEAMSSQATMTSCHIVGRSSQSLFRICSSTTMPLDMAAAHCMKQVGGNSGSTPCVLLKLKCHM
jgi:hypothetical protein